MAVVRKWNIPTVLLPVWNLDTFLKNDILLKYERLPANKAASHVEVVSRMYKIHNLAEPGPCPLCFRRSLSLNDIRINKSCVWGLEGS